MRKVDSKLYDKKYFLNAVEGYQNFNNFLTKINSKYKKGLNMAELKKGEKVLDVGCGRGEMVFYSNILFGCEGVGIDYSEAAIEVCNMLKKDLKNSLVNFLYVDSNILPFEDNSFDVVFFMDVWEHVYPEQIKILLKEFNRVLKKDGRIIVHTSPNKVFFDKGFPRYTFYFNFIINNLVFKPFFGREMARSKKNPRSDYELVMHINEQSEKAVHQELCNAGFLNKTVISDYPIMFSSLFMFFYYLIAQPFYLPFLRNIFGEHIWAIGKK